MRRKTALIIYLVLTLLVGLLACAIYYIPDYLPFELPVYRIQQIHEIHATISAPSGSSSETILSPTAIPEQYPDN